MCYLVCSRGSCRILCILDLLSSVAVTFLLSVSEAAKEEAQGGLGLMEMEEEIYLIWLL